MMKKEKELLVAIASQKGGVGKSVFTVLLASVLHYRKDVRVAVVDCDSPQHSIALMRERDMENVMKNDDLKVNLYRQYERIRKPAYPVIKSDPEQAAMMFICKRLKLNYKKLSEEEKKWLKKIAQKSDLLKNPKPQRGRK